MAFPSSPTNGQQAVVNGITYQYNASRHSWLRLAAGTDTFVVNNIVANSNISAAAYYWANGTPFSSSTYSNVQVAAYLPTYTGNIAAGNVITGGFFWSNGTPVSFGSGGGGSAIVVQDEGSTLTSGATSFNFVGSGVTATNTGTDVTVTITGGGGGSFVYTAAATPPAAANVTGDQWFNTTSNVLYEYLYDGTSYFWVDISSSTSSTSTGYVSRKYTTDGTTAGYTVSTGCSIFNVMVYLNGIAQTPSDDYTISGATLTFTEIPAAGQVLQIRELPR